MTDETAQVVPGPGTDDVRTTRRRGVREFAADAVDAGFARLARRRRARAFHPRGAVFNARLLITAPRTPTGRALLTGLPSATPQRPALVRLSKAVGTPGGLPDLLGVAVRTTSAAGSPLDLLFTTTGRHRATRLLLAPTTGWGRRPYSTLLPYRAEGVRVTLGIEPEDPERAPGTELAALRREVAHAPLAFTLTEKPAGGPRRPVARLLLLAEAPGVAVSFDPVVNDDPRLRLRGLRGLRRWAYAGSRRGRQRHVQLPAQREQRV